MMRLPGAAAVAVAAAAILSCGGSERGTTAREPPTPANTPSVSKDVALFFEAPNLLLVAERRGLTLPSSPAGAIQGIMAGLIAGPQSANLSPTIPAGVQVRAAFHLPDGTAVLDLTGPAFEEGWPVGAHGEWMAIQSIAHTLHENLPEVRRIRFLVDGQAPPSLGGHIATQWAIVPVASARGDRQGQTAAAATPAEPR